MRKLEGWKAVVSVPSQRKAWEVYLLEVYYPDDPTRLCRPKAGQSLYVQNVQEQWMLQISICLLQVSYRAASDTAWVFKATNFRRQKQNRPAPKNVTLSDYQSMPELKNYYNHATGQ